MHQQLASTEPYRHPHPVRVPAPHGYDGIGLALRAAFRDHRDPPDAIALALRRLDAID